MDQAIVDFVAAKRIAVVGASRTGRKFGNSVVTELKQRGYQVLVVHPQAQAIGDEVCYPNLNALRGQADAVWVGVVPERAAQVVREAAEAGIPQVWLQQGAESAEAQAVAKQAGLHLVSGKCILMYAPPVGSFHGWHRAFMRLVGKL